MLRIIDWQAFGLVPSVVIVVVMYVVSLGVYRLLLHPLAGVPGKTCRLLRFSDCLIPDAMIDFDL